jgi:hypothetical protein
MSDTSKDFLGSIVAGAGGGLALVASVVWLFRDKFHNAVENTLDVRKNNIKEKLDDWYKEDNEERKLWYEATRRMAHSVKGLRKIMTRHEQQLREMQRIPMLMQQQITLLAKVNETLEDVQKVAGEHAVQIGVLIERRKHERT